MWCSSLVDVSEVRGPQNCFIDLYTIKKAPQSYAVLIREFLAARMDQRSRVDGGLNVISTDTSTACRI